MQLFLEIYGYLKVVMRGWILAAQTLTLGGAAFLVFAAPAGDSAFDQAARRSVIMHSVWRSGKPFRWSERVISA